MFQRIFMLLFGILISTSLFASSRPVLMDGFDEIGIWGPATWENNIGNVALSQQYVSQGKYSLMAEFRETTEFNKAIVDTEEPQDLSRVKDLYLDIYSESSGLNFFSLACTTGPEWDWHESQTFRLVPGWNRDIRIRVSGNLWKAKRTEWVYRASLRNAKDVRRISLCFWGSGGKVFVDNMRASGTGIKPLKFNFGNPLTLWESFEKKAREWVKPSWETKTVNVLTSRENVSEGEYSLKCDFEDILTTANAAVSCDYKGDWSKVKKIFLDIYNDTGKWLKFTFALITSDQWTWYETTSRFLSPGWNKNLCFNLEEPKFKTAETEWKNVSNLGAPNNIQRVALNFLGTSADQGITGSVFIDNIRVEEKTEGQK